MKTTTIKALAHLINERGMTRYQIAQELGITPINITRYLKGGIMKKDTADKFELIFGITITDFQKPKQVDL